MSLENGSSKSMNGLVHNPETVVGEDLVKIGSSREKDVLQQPSLNTSLAESSSGSNNSWPQNSPLSQDTQVCEVCDDICGVG